ncbi:MAG TPA: DUF309 domain-containing protein [Campylobacterales bacterium]|nr:DUF309 domain-containing protein [Campylobacterales bacterium]HHC11445.1 DUF309 domain-containing protein [Campylobacterales bacterium]
MLKYNYDLEDALKKYINLLNKRLYFEAHEVLEEAWHPLRKANHPLKNLVKGLINASIAFEHIKRNRPEAKDRANRVIVSYEKYKLLSIYGIENYKIFNKAIKKIELIKRNKEIFIKDVL